MPPSKIIQFDAAAAFFANLRQQGKKIVQSHGVFELLLPGHVVHLEEAKAMGDVLVATVTADRHVNKGPGRSKPSMPFARTFSARVRISSRAKTPRPFNSRKKSRR